MNDRAVESLGKTQKRKRNEEEENARPEQKSRRSGSDTIAYLREKNVLVQKLKEEQLQLQKQRVEVNAYRLMHYVEWHTQRTFFQLH